MFIPYENGYLQERSQLSAKTINIIQSYTSS